ncbi:related to Mediator of RNA polymerase II transcription subunit 31 [Hanseniaspora guilliermondii]|uniref:Mediator of RNA polymerase II transcription subunit 31 n=1 Tax=Hanseniaspora guilliermondii TaxID=56406 RepID=A0A1L0CJE9_9ASCO|nr:related to Mediator of RNA polymerase II transcription subunit 31 [Hanseniaspora guilliermondii]
MSTEIPADVPVQEMKPPSRFEVEIEFVNSLSNINYINYLIKNRNLLKDSSFLRYLIYLYVTYCCNVEFKKYIIYPNCLVFIKILVDNIITEEEIRITSIDKVLQELNDPKLFTEMYDNFKSK